MTPRVSIVMPAHEEAEGIVVALDRLFEVVSLPCEVLVVVDRVEDSTFPYLLHYAQEEPRLVPLVNRLGPGPANAIRFGIQSAASNVVVVTMSDGSDDPLQIDQLARLVERGVAIAAASRYCRGGQQIGGPLLKSLMSRAAGLSLSLLPGVGTRDPTNSFKAYSKRLIDDVGIESDAGFEIGLELVAKARRARLPVVEVPTIWIDRSRGSSNFKLLPWLPRYLRWYLYAFGPRVPRHHARRPTIAGVPT